ncbi:MAG: hypothetical protein AMJ73_08730 [candidate division Zixibacteria bacterium SM1_73]|nr:MAG: hypothetical protein AMJ73_08730 [candidate division Zixibacteria bacterium SM1_73]
MSNKSFAFLKKLASREQMKCFAIVVVRFIGSFQNLTSRTTTINSNVIIPDTMLPPHPNPLPLGERGKASRM